MVAAVPPCWRSRTERGFSRNKGLHARSGEAASCEPSRKTVQSEGSLRSKPATAVAFLLLPFLWRRKENEVSGGGRVSAE